MRQSTFSAAIADLPLRPFQIVVMVFGLALLVIDGIDLQSLSLVTPVILEEWNIDRAVFGPALAASLFGMGFGSIFGGMLGDRIGRLRTLAIACAIFGGSTILASFTNGVWEMAAVRALGGLGFGAAYPNALALVSDWVNEKTRPHAVSFLSVGIPVGISVSAAVMPLMLPAYGWRGAFMIFGVGSLVLGALLVAVLREPPAWLLTRGRREAAQKSASRVIDGSIELLPEVVTSPDAAPGEQIGVFHRSNNRLNLGMVISFSATTTLVYGLLNWTPTLLTSAGLSLDDALRASFWQGILSIIGGLSAGLTTRTFGSKAVTIAGAAAILATILGLAIIIEGANGAPTAGQVEAIVWLEGLAVGLVSMMITVFYVIMASGYAHSCRAGGIGMVITSGRVMSISMVLGGGWLMNLGGDSFIWYFATLVVISLMVFAAAFIVDCQVEPKRRLQPA
ncbi:MFS transporter [Altererythrobacter salegens]|uniref:MFS transporter n=1 Tax=Croceibacterium salegens TaxID=1737568 RepID=A0A6I4SRY7_9SPHN|nr:MFS transporter [Croceibacterium salegens]MXO58741.1 MFS transporter [Croceibacterium salegens]